jgi:hypothetical protein
MRLSTLALALVGFAALGSVAWIVRRATEESRRWNSLLAWAGKDLSELSSHERRNIEDLALHYGDPQKEIAQTVRGQMVEGHPDFRWIVRLDGPGGLQRVLLVWYGLRDRFLMVVLDEHRRPSTRVWLRTVARLETVIDIRPISRPDCAPWMFDVVLDRVGEGAVAVEHYAVNPEGPILLRLEASNGSLIRNSYQDWSPVGPIPPRISPDEMERFLFDADRARVLQALVWFGGRHAPVVFPRAGTPREPAEVSSAFEASVQKETVRRRILELRDAGHPWIREAARAVELPGP